MHTTFASQSKPLIHLDLEASAFTSDWRHCDQVANYLARLASFDRADSFLYSNLLSTVLNELFEIVFFKHRKPCTLGCTLLRDGATDRIELTIPAGESERAFYQQAVTAAQSGEVGEAYMRTLLNDRPPDRSIGFLELAADYGAEVHLEDCEDGEALRVTFDLRLEDNHQPATAAHA